MLSVTLYNTTFVGCICLQDVLSLSVDDSETACNLKKENFDSQETCTCTQQCNIESIDQVLKTSGSYEIEELIIKFSETVQYSWEPSCRTYSNTNVYVTFNCEDKYNKARRLGESCSDPMQCLTNNPNSTCSQTNNVCECKEGYMEVLNACTKDRQLLNEVCESYLQSGISNHEQRDIQTNCSTLHPTNVNPSIDKIRTSYTGIIVAVAFAGILFGIAVSASVFFFMIRRLKKSQNRQMGSLEDMATRKQNVQVSGDVKSRSVVGTNRSDTEENGIYDHLHEDHIELQDQSDYDHCPPHVAPDDMYSHLASHNDKSEDYMGDYREIN